MTGTPLVVKLAVCAPAYALFAPALGYFATFFRHWRRWSLMLMIFLTACYPSRITVNVDSIQWYRGHTKGFEFSLYGVLAIAMLVASYFDRRWHPPKKWPPGLTLWLVLTLVCSLSVIGSIDPVYGLMTTMKFLTAAIIFVACYYVFGHPDDLKWVFRAFVVVLIQQALIGLKYRYWNGYWQVHGWFQHQNSLAMWAYTCSLIVLAAAISKHTKPREAVWYFLGYMASGLIIVLTVSRASTAAFSIGSVLVYLLALPRDRPTRVVSIGLLCLVGATLVAFFGTHSLRARVDDAEDLHGPTLRHVLNIQAAAMLHDHPFGVGWNNYGLENSDPLGHYSYVVADWDRACGQRIPVGGLRRQALPESFFWLFLAETGYPGFVLIVAFMLLTLWWAGVSTRFYWKTAAAPFVCGLFVVLLLNYGHSCVERILIHTKNVALWMFLAGALARLYVMRPVKLGFWGRYFPRRL